VVDGSDGDAGGGDQPVFGVEVEGDAVLAVEAADQGEEDVGGFFGASDLSAVLGGAGSVEAGCARRRSTGRGRSATVSGPCSSGGSRVADGPLRVVGSGGWSQDRSRM
jgi:hypothetical protein